MICAERSKVSEVPSVLKLARVSMISGKSLCSAHDHGFRVSKFFAKEARNNELWMREKHDLLLHCAVSKNASSKAFVCKIHVAVPRRVVFDLHNRRLGLRQEKKFVRKRSTTHNAI